MLDQVSQFGVRIDGQDALAGGGGCRDPEDGAERGARNTRSACLVIKLKDEEGCVLTSRVY